MKSFFEEYSKIIGLLLLAFVIIMLFATPSMIFAKAITTIDTELSHASRDETPVRTLMDFGSNEHIRSFPKQIGDWNGSDYNTTRIAESLGADVMLMRAYSHPKLYQPVFFLIMQSNKVTMVRVSALAPLEGSYDGILDITKEFMGDTIPCMFEIREEEEPIIFIVLASGSGSVIGKVAVVLLFLALLTIIFYPHRN